MLGHGRGQGWSAMGRGALRLRPAVNSAPPAGFQLSLDNQFGIPVFVVPCTQIQGILPERCLVETGLPVGELL